jgi:hypothetical protein
MDGIKSAPVIVSQGPAPAGGADPEPTEIPQAAAKPQPARVVGFAGAPAKGPKFDSKREAAVFPSIQEHLVDDVAAIVAQYHGPGVDPESVVLIDAQPGFNGMLEGGPSPYFERQTAGMISEWQQGKDTFLVVKVGDAWRNLPIRGMDYEAASEGKSAIARITVDPAKAHELGLIDASQATPDAEITIRYEMDKVQPNFYRDYR